MTSSFLTRIPTSGWESRCIVVLQNTFGGRLENLTHGLVDGSGRSVTSFDNQTWGIDIDTCTRYCSTDSLPFPNFDLHQFSSALTNYLLPWLALTAQLPYDTGSPWSDVMSFCLAVGSPALITYSLTVTILNRYWVRQHFHTLTARMQKNSRWARYEKRIEAARYLLEEAQQVPLRAPQYKGWLSSLIVKPENEDWWLDLKKRLRRTRRGVTASLVAQVLSAAIAYLFTVISSFSASIDDLGTAMQISAGSLWIWLIPIICGWIVVGTQYTHDTIEDALRANTADRAPNTGSEGSLERGEQSGITVGVTLHNPPSWLGADISGDEGQKGPVYNYARIFTWWQLSNTLAKAFEVMPTNMENEQMCNGGQSEANHPQGNDPPGNGDASETAEDCGLSSDQRGQILAYPAYKEVDPGVWWRMGIASLMAVFVQWGTTGASILIAYLTQVKGLGCRSGGYLLYGVLATLAWLSLLVSILLSHAAMLHYQHKASSVDSTLRGAAVISRYTGKGLAAANAAWLIVSTIFEYIGVYDNCWCNGVVLSHGMKSWVMLFRTKEEFRDAAKNAWAGGVTMTIIVCFCTVCVFVISIRKS